jgi:hypothetical protein
MGSPESESDVDEEFREQINRIIEAQRDVLDELAD